MTDERLLASLAHPVRRQALEQIAHGPASASEIARERGLTLGTVAYHVRVLADAGLVKKHRTGRVRGALKTTYRLAPVNGLAGELAGVARELVALAATLHEVSTSEPPPRPECVTGGRDG